MAQYTFNHNEVYIELVTWATLEFDHNFKNNSSKIKSNKIINFFTLNFLIAYYIDKFIEMIF